MPKKENAALEEATVEFVQKVITEVYGQQATHAKVAAIAKRVIDTLPMNGTQRPKAAI